MNPSGQKTKLLYRVKPARLTSGTWNGEQLVNEGDICRSYSGDRIGENNPVRPPFQWQGSLWTCIGMMVCAGVQAEAWAYRLVPETLFDGEPTSYDAKTRSEEDREAALTNPMGPYHAMRVRYKGDNFILCGPQATFIPDSEDGSNTETAAVQLGLF
jgi:hypothetical protein